MKCNSCSKEYDDSFSFCPYCSTPKPADETPKAPPKPEQNITDESPAPKAPSTPVTPSKNEFVIWLKRNRRSVTLVGAVCCIIVVALIIGLVLHNQSVEKHRREAQARVLKKQEEKQAKLDKELQAPLSTTIEDVGTGRVEYNGVIFNIPSGYKLVKAPWAHLTWGNNPTADAKWSAENTFNQQKTAFVIKASQKGLEPAEDVPVADLDKMWHRCKGIEIQFGGPGPSGGPAKYGTDNMPPVTTGTVSGYPYEAWGSEPFRIYEVYFPTSKLSIDTMDSEYRPIQEQVLAGLEIPSNYAYTEPPFTPSPNPTPAVPATPTPVPTPVNPPTMTMAEFNAIQSGMTYEQVVQIVGGPGEKLSESGSPGDEYYTVMYSWKGEGSLGANASCMFQRGGLVNKSQVGLE